MSLIDKLKIGQTGKRKVLAGIVAGAITVGLAGGCSRNSNYDNSQAPNATVSTEVYQRDKDKKSKNKQEYTYERFVKALGPERPIRDEKDLKEFFDSDIKVDVIFCKVMTEVYKNPEKVKERMTENEKKDYANFKLSEDKIREYQEKLHWVLEQKNSELSESDKLMLFLIDSRFSRDHGESLEEFIMFLNETAEDLLRYVP